MLSMVQFRPLVGEAEAAGVAQGVRVGTLQPGTLGRRGDEVVDRLAGERLAALGQEQPGQLALAHGEVAADHAQLVAGDGLLDQQSALEASHPQPGAIQVQLVAAQAGGGSVKNLGQPACLSRADQPG